MTDVATKCDERVTISAKCMIVEARSLRIAWLGSAVDGGGVGGFGRDLLRGLLRLGQDVTLFTPENPKDQHRRLDADAAIGGGALHVEHEPLAWQWDRWYSGHHATIFFSSLIARSRLHGRLVKRLVAKHRENPFDAVVQFSQFELLSMKRRLRELPPVVLLPCVHAAGELEWHRKESAVARQSEARWKHVAIRANLAYRAAVQRRDAGRVSMVLGMSERFNELIRRDYGVPAARQAVVYQPAVDLDAGPGPAVRCRAASDPVRLIFVGRIAVRKGIDQLVELSRRLSRDCLGRVTIEVVGGPSFWSNYTGELSKLTPEIGRHLGALPHHEILELMSRSDVLLVPSKYEPGGIVVAEAASQGCIPVVSNEVGSGEPLGDDVCEKFEAGDINEFESAVRRAIARVEREGMTLRHRVAAAARSQFDLHVQSQRLLDALQDTVHRSRANVQCIGA